jgi:hypothetical protein
VPPKSWTAWPLTADIVPRPSPHLLAENEDRSTPDHGGSRSELEELLIANVLSTAKKRFTEREWESSSTGSKAEVDPDGTSDGEDDDNLSAPDDSTDPLLSSLEEEEGSPRRQQPPEETASGEATTAGREKSKDTKIYARTTISADDERSKSLLLPSIRHCLTELDKVLMALHHARQTCLYYSSDRSDSETQTDNESSKPPITEDLPRHTRSRLKKSIPSADNMTDSPAPGLREQSTKRGTDPRARRRRAARLGLRDWSELLGTAALVGVSPDVIRRTTQRCASLFGEGMTFIEDHSMVGGKEWQRLDYLQDQIPGDSSASESDSKPADGQKGPRVRKRYSQGDTYRRPLKHTQSGADTGGSDSEVRGRSDVTFFCPVEDCPRARHGFVRRYNVSRHLQEAHFMDETEVREVLDRSSESLEEGVHTDGYLKHIRRRAGWTGKRTRLTNAEYERKKTPNSKHGSEHME